MNDPFVNRVVVPDLGWEEQFPALTSPCHGIRASAQTVPGHKTNWVLMELTLSEVPPLPRCKVSSSGLGKKLVPAETANSTTLPALFSGPYMQQL